MEKTFKDRLHVLMGSKSGRKFAADCGVQDSTMRGYLLGKYEPTIENLVKIASACNITVGWLAAGEESPGCPNRTGAATNESLAAYNVDQTKPPPGRATAPKEEINVHDGVMMTTKVLSSKTGYANALWHNLKSFEAAVDREGEMSELTEKVDALTRMVESLQEKLGAVATPEEHGKKREATG